MRAALVLIAVVSGCAGMFEPPRSQLHARSLNQVERRPGAAEVSIELEAQLLMLSATRRDQCVYEITETIATPKWRGRTQFSQQRGGQITTPCAVPAANATIRVTLPSGTTVDAVSDDDGRAVLVLAPHEAPSVVGAVRAAVLGSAEPARQGEPEEIEEGWTEVPDVAVAPSAPMATAGRTAVPGKPRKGLSIVRDALVECGTQHGIRGLVRVTLSLAEKARIVGADTRRAGAFQTCVDAALVGQYLPVSRPAGTLEFPYVIK